MTILVSLVQTVVMEGAAVTQQANGKDWVVTLILAIILPGIDRIYAGSIGLGIVKIFTGAGFGVWWLVDIIKLVTGSYKDGSGVPISK